MDLFIHLFFEKAYSLKDLNRGRKDDIATDFRHFILKRSS